MAISPHARDHRNARQQQIDFVAVDWTDGVFQTELAVQSGTVTKINETQRQRPVVPYLPGTASRIEFVTDVLGVEESAFGKRALSVCRVVLGRI